MVSAFSLFAILFTKVFELVVKNHPIVYLTLKITYSSAEGILVLSSRIKSHLSGLEPKLI